MTVHHFSQSKSYEQPRHIITNERSVASDTTK